MTQDPTTRDSTPRWHIDDPTWRAYADGRLGAAAEASVEAHAAACATCRAGARALVPDPAPVWREVHTAISEPRLPWPLRRLRAAGVPEDDLSVLETGDSLWLPWTVAVGGALASVIAAANLGHHHDTAFLLLAPLVPVLAVVAAYDVTDPLRELTAATSYSKLRLALLRTVATLVVAVPSTLVLSLAVPVLHRLAWIWLLPSLGLTTAALVLLTRTTPRVTGGLVATAWAAAVLLASDSGQLQVLGTATGQAGFALLAAGLAAVLVHSAGTVPARRAGR